MSEHDWYGKNIAPMYEEIIHIPFFMHAPLYQDKQGKSVEGIAQTIDIASTLLDYFEITDEFDRDGKSLMN